MEETERAALRAKHQVRSLTDREDGTGLHRLPNGVCGFTYAPGPRDAPLFRTPRPHTFEVHKLADGKVMLVGYVAPEVAARIENDPQLVEVRLFPAPRNEANTLVSLPLTRMVRHREFSTRDGGAFEMHLGPAAGL